MQIIHLLHILKDSSLPKEYFISFVPSWAVKTSLSLICLLDFEHLISNVMLQIPKCMPAVSALRDKFEIPQGLAIQE